MPVHVKARFLVTCLTTGETRVVGPSEPDLEPIAWSVGGMGTGAIVEIDEPLEGVTLRISTGGHHVLLYGNFSDGSHGSMPPIAIRQRTPDACDFPTIRARFLALLSNPDGNDKPGRWLAVDPTRFANRVFDIYVRFDRNPLRIGEHMIETKLTRHGSEERKPIRRDPAAARRSAAARPVKLPNDS